MKCGFIDENSANALRNHAVLYERAVTVPLILDDVETRWEYLRVASDVQK
jgi:hypothetical protein